MNKRRVFGIIVAPITAPLVFIFFLTGKVALPMDMDSLSIVMTFGLPIAYLVAILFGLPLLKIVEKFGLVNFWSVTIGGGIAAVLPVLMIYTLNATLFSLTEKDINVFGVMFACGLVAGFVFWLVAFFKEEN